MTNGVRPWAIPGMAGLQHRIGGIEKEDGTGNISYEPLNHEKMVRCGPRKCARWWRTFKPIRPRNGVESGDLLILGWGSTYGAIRTAVNEMCAEGHCVAMCICVTSSPSARSWARSYRVTSAC
jgi:2-oxoglutarate ferredoxin oxidoreductase subunit alpha